MKKLAVLTACILSGISINVNADKLPSSLSLNALLDFNRDNNLPHEALAQGVPITYDWAKNPRLGAGNNKGNWATWTGWAQFFWAVGQNSSTDRVQVRNMQSFVCYVTPSGNQWRLDQAGAIVGSQFNPDFVGNVSTALPFFQQGTDNVATSAFDLNTVFHFWTKFGHSTLPEGNICGFVVLLEAREISNTGTKTTVPNKFLIGLGADYWASQGATWNNFTTNTDIAIGRFKYVKQDWAWYGLSTASNSDLTNFYNNGYTPVPYISWLRTNKIPF